jgi:putative NADPH-quinone reductase
MQADEWRGHKDIAAPPRELQVYVEALQWAEACVFCFPTWWLGMPAILKGYFDRVWRPGIAFEVPKDGGLIRPALHNIRRFGVVTTCGSPWWYTRLYTQDPARKVLLRGLKGMCGRTEKHLYLAQHSVESITQDARERFARRVEERFSRF